MFLYAEHKLICISRPHLGILPLREFWRASKRGMKRQVRPRKRFLLRILAEGQKNIIERYNKSKRPTSQKLGE
jgi:hypothetical protein